MLSNKCSCGEHIVAKNFGLPICISCPCGDKLHTILDLDKHDIHLVRVNNIPRPTLFEISKRIARDALRAYCNNFILVINNSALNLCIVQAVYDEILAIGCIGYAFHNEQTIDLVAEKLAIAIISNFLSGSGGFRPSDMKDDRVIKSIAMTRQSLLNIGLVKSKQEGKNGYCKWCHQMRLLNIEEFCDACEYGTNE